MVYTIDPSRTDPATRTLRYLQNLFWIKNNKFSENYISNAINIFLQDTQYKNLFEEFDKEKVEFPKIILRNNCKTNQYFMLRKGINYKFFPGEYDKNYNKLYICSNLMTNLMEIKENLDRELTLAYDFQILKKDFKNNKEYACSQIRSCKAHFENYPNMNEELKINLTKICSKYLYRVKFFKNIIKQDGIY